MNAPVENLPPVSDALVARIKAIEARWGKDFMEVMVDLHDHVFGASNPAPTEGSEAPESSPVAPAASELTGNPPGSSTMEGTNVSSGGSEDGAGDEGGEGSDKQS